NVAKAFASAVLSGVKALADSLFQLGQSLITFINSLLTQSLDIPFVSSLYSWITNGSQLTVADLIALILAIPVTTAYKLVYNKAPFPDAASVTNLTNNFTSHKMLQAAGYAHLDKEMKVQGVQPLLTPDQAQILSIVNGIACFA